MMFGWVFWLSFWSALLAGPDAPPKPTPVGGLVGPVTRPSGTVIHLAAWRAEHRPGPTGGRAA